MKRQEAINEIISLAMRERGYCEGANNYNKYAPIAAQSIGWLAQNQPWCAIFVVALFVMTFGCEKACAILRGSVGFISAACRTNAERFRAANSFYTTPEVGDIVYFYYDGAINHEGIVTKVTSTIIETIEGNSGDKVASSTYYRSDSRIAGYGRPKYELAEDLPDSNIKESFNEPSFCLKEGDGMGCPSAEVMAWQSVLVSRGVYDEKRLISKFVDGEFGPKTKLYTEILQKQLCVPDNGIVDEDDWIAALGLISIKTDIPEIAEEHKVT